MAKILPVLVGAAALVLSFGAQPQGRSDPFEEEHVDCAAARNPKGCRERRARLEVLQAQVRKACEAKPEAEREACMRAEWCRDSPDPARCDQLQAKRAAAREACKARQGDEQRSCMREAMAR